MKQVFTMTKLLINSLKLKGKNFITLVEKEFKTLKYLFLKEDFQGLMINKTKILQGN